MSTDHRRNSVRRLVGLAILAAGAWGLVALSADYSVPAHTQSPVTMTPPATWTGVVPTPNWTPNPRIGPSISEGDWSVTSTLQPSGGTCTPPPTP